MKNNNFLDKSNYQDSTLGSKDSDNVNVIAFKQFTNPTKSIYDNVIGWAVLR